MIIFTAYLGTILGIAMVSIMVHLGLNDQVTFWSGEESVRLFGASLTIATAVWGFALATYTVYLSWGLL